MSFQTKIGQKEICLEFVLGVKNGQCEISGMFTLAGKHLQTTIGLYSNNVPGYVCNPGSPRERDAASKTLGERHQRYPALNHKCNQSKLTARRQVRVTSRPGCLKARDVQPAPASRNEAKL